ncbi:MAG: prolyl oligopeptidase family serine peptidase [Verrucomicrobiota bacterium]
MSANLHQPAGELNQGVRIYADGVYLLADLQVPEESSALVLFAHNGRCRNHPRNRHIAQVIRDMGLGTLLCDLLTEEELGEDDETAKYRNDAELLAKRLIAVTQWAANDPAAKDLQIGYFGASAGGAAALIAAAKMRQQVGAVVARGGCLDLATQSMSHVLCPTLLIVGENDLEGIEITRKVLPQLKGKKELQVVPGASHLFDEPGTMVTMAGMGAEWLHRHLGKFICCK